MRGINSASAPNWQLRAQFSFLFPVKQQTERRGQLSAISNEVQRNRE
jgi:hypothetical protein